MNQLKKILFQRSTTILAENRRENGNYIILICQMFLTFISLSLNNICLGHSFDGIQEKIHKKTICRINYNFSKTAAIVNPSCGSAVYINFKTKQTKVIIKDWPDVFAMWKTNDIAHLKGSCGTGCSQSIIFMAPTTSISCPIHEYRFENLSENEPPDFYNNDPLFIEPHKKTYACYAEENVIQIFQMPRKLLTTLNPPKGYYAESATIYHHQLVINYRDAKEKVKQITYKKINL